ncbi:hypothetical protein VCHENC02_3033B, partial [Vibrio harveyi]
ALGGFGHCILWCNQPAPMCNTSIRYHVTWDDHVCITNILLDLT